MPFTEPDINLPEMPWPKNSHFLIRHLLYIDGYQDEYAALAAAGVTISPLDEVEPECTPEKCHDALDIWQATQPEPKDFSEFWNAGEFPFPVGGEGAYAYEIILGLSGGGMGENQDLRDYLTKGIPVDQLDKPPGLRAKYIEKYILWMAAKAFQMAVARFCLNCFGLDNRGRPPSS